MTLVQGKLAKGGVRLFTFPRSHDERGSFNAYPFDNPYYELPKFVECNVSRSKAGVIRGLHFQTRAFAQGKLVTCLQGAVLDVFVDLRPESPTFGQHGTYELHGGTGEAIYIPEGFAHGFQALQDNTLFQYHVTRHYEPNYQGGIHWLDPDLNIQWAPGWQFARLSDRDRDLPTLRDWKKSLP